MKASKRERQKRALARLRRQLSFATMPVPDHALIKHEPDQKRIDRIEREIATLEAQV